MTAKKHDRSQADNKSLSENPSPSAPFPASGARGGGSSIGSKSAAARRRGSRGKWPRWLIVGLLLFAVCGLSLSAGGLAGFLAGFFAGRRKAPTTAKSAPVEEDATLWTCAMHPQIKLPKPGKCPICFMDLIPLKTESGGGDPRQLKMSPQAVALANIQTEWVKREYVSKLVRMVGKVDYDETKLAEITSWIPNGRLDELYVDYTNTTVRKGEHLYSIYSPDLVVAQRELLLDLSSNPRSPGKKLSQWDWNSAQSAEAKLRRWGLLPEQIEEFKRRGRPEDHVTIYSPVSGVVIRKYANERAYVKEGTKIYTIADLSHVWVFLDAYESDEPWLREGQEAEFTTESYPGEIFKGRIELVDPVLNEKTRTVKVRLGVSNEDRRLKPGMFVHAIVRSKLAAGGRVLDASLAGKWICPMHPEIVKDGPHQGADVMVTTFDSDVHPDHPAVRPQVVKSGPPTCDICGMDLVPAEELGFVAPDQAPEPPLVIPATAPLQTGKRAVVYVKLPGIEEPTFEGREVLLGDRVSDYYIVRHGLREGEEVVTKGNFKIDSALQIHANPSMMSPADEVWPSADDQARRPLEVPGGFRTSLDGVYRSYLAAGRALAGDDLADAQPEVRRLLAAVQAVEIGELDSAAQSRWKTVTDQIIFAAYEMIDARNLDTAREHFSDLSRGLVWLAQSFGHALPEPMFRLHCSMALAHQGAGWMQLGKEPANPYLGSAMPRCGQQVATFHSQAPLENVPREFHRRLSGLYGSYLKLQQALADDRLKDALAAWRAMRLGLDSVSPNGLDDRAARAWQAIGEDLQGELKVDGGKAKIEQLRKKFETVSATILAMVTLFGHAEHAPLSKVFCPMAFDSKGAFWLQAGKKIANPYFGHKMRSCGEIRRTFAPAGRAPLKEKPIKEERR